jgi:hypothetical protein
MHRNLLSPALLEVLQVLKHIYKQGCLDFTSDLITTEEDYSIERVTEEAINELVSCLFHSEKRTSLWICCTAWKILIVIPRLRLFTS